MKVFAILTLLILFLFSPCSSDALTLAIPPWDFNIANLVKHTDLVVLGKVTGMRLIPQEYATSITLKVESVIKGDPAVEDRLLRFTVSGNAGMKKYRGKPILWGVEGSLEFKLGERLLLFMKGSHSDYRIFRPGGKIMVTDNKVSIPYTYKINRFSDYYNEMRERKVRRSVELPLDLVVKVAKASIKDYDAIKEIEADVAKAVSLTPRERQHASPRTRLSVELLKRLEETADQILEKRADGDEWVGTRQLETIEGKSLEPPITVEFDNSVDIPDPNLRAEIERELGRTSIAPITAADMERLTTLDADIADISDLTGLEAAINLAALDLSVNNISDLSALSELTNLTRLMLSHNSLSDISVVSGLTNLTELYLHANSISDVSALSELTNLTSLGLNANAISDISAVSGLTNLAWLELWNNSISDISVVSGLTKLTLLHLGKNNISDLSPLVSNAGLERGDTVDVDENPLNAVSLNTHIPTLKSRGVEVRFDTVAVQPVDIPDPNLRAAIEAELGKPAGNTITVADMERLTTLDAGIADISDLTGLEAAINLTAPNLSINTLSDISALAGLIHLTHLSLMDNTLSDISALSGLTNLTWLDLSINTLSDISALSKLTNLTHLSLMDNSISDISALSGLTNLTHLWLHNNSISDVSALSGLTHLTLLWLGNNAISDISAVSGLTHLTLLWLRRNAISDISAVSGLTHLTNLGLNGNSISDISPLVANTGLGSGDSVDVWGNPLSAVSINTHIPTLQSRGVNVRVDTPVNIPDRNFRAKIEAELGKPAGDAITVEDMQSLRELDASHANISDLTGLEYATNLTHLSLIDNTLSDISALAGLTNLTGLDLFGNNISDLSPLAGLINLTSLDLMDNSVSDISALAGLTNLTWLNLIDNSVSDISALAGLTNLTFLDLSKNNISDISASAKLTNLTRLALYDNTLSDISALSGLTNLEGLYLGKNALSDISALSGLTNLIQLWLRGNNISDISPLVANTGLGSGDCVEVWGNPLSDESINTHIPALQSRGVTVHFE